MTRQYNNNILQYSRVWKNTNTFTYFDMPMKSACHTAIPEILDSRLNSGSFNINSRNSKCESVCYRRQLIDWNDIIGQANKMLPWRSVGGKHTRRQTID